MVGIDGLAHALGLIAGHGLRLPEEQHRVALIANHGWIVGVLVERRELRLEAGRRVKLQRDREVRGARERQE